MPKKIINKIEEEVNEVVAEVKAEANEEVGTVTFKRWQVVVAAIVVTALLIALVV